MEYKATVKYLRQSPRKLRLVADAVRSMSPLEAVSVLSHMPKRAADPLSNAIGSALANAKQVNAKPEELHFKTLEVTEGPVMKRFRAVARGVAHGYKKRMSHIRVVLTDETVKE